MATDLWFSVTLGLRSTEILELSIQNNDGDFFDVIKVLERKNHH